MSETQRFVPSEVAEAQSPEIGQEEVQPSSSRGLAVMREHQGWFAAMVVTVGMMAGMRDGKAAELPPQSADAEKHAEFDHEERLKAESKDGHVLYVQGVRENVQIGVDDVSGKETLTLVRVDDEGDPNVKGDEMRYIAKFIHFAPIDGKTEQVFAEEISAEGIVRPGSQLFGTVTGFPESLQARGGNLELARNQLNARLSRLSDRLHILRGLYAVGKGESPEAVRLRSNLQEAVKKVQNTFPDVPLPQEALDELGR